MQAWWAIRSGWPPYCAALDDLPPEVGAGLEYLLVRLGTGPATGVAVPE